MTAQQLKAVGLIMGCLTVNEVVANEAELKTPFQFEMVSSKGLWSQYNEVSWYRLGMAYLENDRFLESTNCFHLSLDYNPDFVEAYQHLGYAYFRLGEFQNAAIALAHAITRDPENAYAHHLLGVIFTIYAMYDSAIAEFERAIALAPGSALMHYDLGFAREFSGSLSLARDAYRKALEIDPAFKEAQDRLTGVERKIYDAAGLKEEAKKTK